MGQPRARVRPRAIEVCQLTKRYGARVAVEDLSFGVSYGRVLGLLGPDGSGKTTTLRAMVGLVPPTSGMVRIDGRSYARLADPVHTMGAVLGSPFHPGRSGRCHLRILAAAAGVPAGRVEELLGVVGLMPAAGRRVSTYTPGMRQRLGVAAALLGDPRIVILDEPAHGLDPQGIAWLGSLLRSLAARGRAVLVSGHVLARGGPDRRRHRGDQSWPLGAAGPAAHPDGRAA